MKEIQKKLASNPGLHLQKNWGRDTVNHRLPATYYPGAKGKWNHFHSILKGCLQTVGLEGKSWKTFTVEVYPTIGLTCNKPYLSCRDRSKVLMSSKAPHEEELLHSSGWVDSWQWITYSIKKSFSYLQTLLWVSQLFLWNYCLSYLLSTAIHCKTSQKNAETQNSRQTADISFPWLAKWDILNQVSASIFRLLKQKIALWKYCVIFT